MRLGTEDRGAVMHEYSPLMHEQQQDDPQGADSRLVRAMRSQEVDCTPVWFMRQAGRSLPEYRALRRAGGLLELCRDPATAAEVTMQPVRRHGVDAAILFSDIVFPLHAIGVGVEIRPGVGPVIDQPVRAWADLERLRPFEPDADAPELGEAVRLVRAELTVPVIGFAGAPFTVASYLVEGGPSKAQARTRALMLSDPALWTALCQRLADHAVSSLEAQVRAGAGAVQLFDSWAGTLSAERYEAQILPVMRSIVERLRPMGVPVISFALGGGHLLELLAAAGPDVVGVDWRTPLSQARARLGDDVAVQGNLDPATCLAGWDVAGAGADAVLADAPARGHVFNLGHGVFPETDPGILTALVAHVHERTASSPAVATASYGA